MKPKKPFMGFQPIEIVGYPFVGPVWNDELKMNVEALHIQYRIKGGHYYKQETVEL